MADALIYRLGETKKIAHLVNADAAFTISTATVVIYDSAGSAVVTANASVDNGDPATEHEVFYVWNPSAAGDYTYLLKYTVGGQSLSIRGEVLVLPVTSKYDRYVRRVESWVQETAMGEEQQNLSYRAYMDSLDAAVVKFNQKHPRRLQDTVALSAGVFEYDLPADWDEDFSVVEEFEFPVNDATQSKCYLDAGDYLVDEVRGKWRFTCNTPGAGESARLTYRARHQVTHTLDTLPAAHFEALCQYAAAQALLKLANKAVQTSARPIGADLVEYRTKQQEYLAQAKFLMKEAETAWGTSSASRANVNTGLEPVWLYLPYHGRMRW